MLRRACAFSDSTWTSFTSRAVGLPRNGLAQVVEILQTTLASLSIHRGDEIRNALLDAQTRVGAAHITPGWVRTEQQVECPGRQPSAQRGDLSWLVYVHSLDFEAAVGRLGEPL